MLLLALDTSTTAITVALLDVSKDGPELLAEETSLDAQRHGELVAPSVQAVLTAAKAEAAAIDLVAVGVGPGPFTGLRVGVVSGLVLGHAVGAPVVGVCSLDALAHHVRAGLEESTPPHFQVCTDARRKEVYRAEYRLGPEGPERRAHPEVIRPADIAAGDAALPTAGRGPMLYPDTFPHPVPVLDVSAAALGRRVAAALARGETVEGLLPGQDEGWLTHPEPWYLRRPDAQPAAARKSVLR